MPDLRETRLAGAAAAALRLDRPERTALLGLLVLAVLFALKAASSLMIPTVLALLLTLVFQPVVDWLVRVRIPAPLAAALVPLVLLLAVGGVVWIVGQQVGDWAERAPQVIERVRTKLGWIRDSVQQVQEAARQVENAASPGEPPSGAVPGAGLLSGMLDQAKLAGADFLVILLLLYFFLFAGRRTVDFAIASLPNAERRERYDRIAHTIREHVGRYLGTIAAINAVMGVIIGGSMWLLGLPNALLWGILSALMKFVPMIGGTVTSLVLTTVAVMTYDDWRWMLIPTLVFLVLNWVEGNIFTPMILGRRLTLNPVALICSIVFWGWLWGVVGAIVAVPILATLKIIFDHHPPLTRVGALLGSLPPEDGTRPAADTAGS
ncbi:AI-2E family transporter [Arenibaculum pallidiluteum]|uniref:AI-2E family transporter n=1 Tax=Arenibaculum pallidiluteum TaxID=2812559 RepID=UPI001A9698FE|nr:AI-2E family transporter [Arenibaculum pallidiluteum]